MHIVIRAGGIGTRLWPLSRADRPKQFLSLISDRTLIAQTLERVGPLAGEEGVYISVNHSFLPLVKETLPGFDASRLIIEPATRNTGPAMCLEVCWLAARLPSETVIASLPSDDYISDAEAFRALLSSSERFILDHPDYIITPAVKPEYPEVGYSYLRAGQVLEDGGEEVLYEVAGMVEKPNREYCEELIESGVHYWHTGMYIWQLGHVASLFKKSQPAMFKACTDIVELMAQAGTEEKIAELYAGLEKMSVESAITSRAEKLAMSVSNRLGWSDVGKWPAVHRIGVPDGEGNVVSETAVLQASRDNLVIGKDAKKLIVLNNVTNLAVIDTPDVLLISDIDATEDMRQIVDRLRQDGKAEYL